MRERRDRLRFALEAGQPVGIGCNRLREDLDRHLAVQFVIPCAVELTHSAGAERRNDLKGAETCAWCEGQAVDYTRREYSEGVRVECHFETIGSIRGAWGPYPPLSEPARTQPMSGVTPRLPPSEPRVSARLPRQI